ncbi:MAG: HEAT repeat domain-containing protein [Reyranella sp.]|uniref:HEAT repeat domain-containing protein n=1 Tax=Reyranella sp. TaxID=1929291 RepID=UPI003D0A8E28
MTERQLDLFSDVDVQTETRASLGTRPAVVAADMDDAALIAAIPAASLADSAALAAEAARRRLAGAVPALAALCRHFTGFGAERPVREQEAALRALAAIGGPDAAQAVSAMIGRAVVQGPTLVVAAAAAAQVKATLSAEILGSLLRHADPDVRVAACRCARPFPDVMAILVGLLGDHDRTVASAAACALGRFGRSEARPALKKLLSEQPSREVVEAVAAVADEECMVLLGRLARNRPAFATAALDALENIDHPRASTIAAAVRRDMGTSAGAG